MCSVVVAFNRLICRFSMLHCEFAYNIPIPSMCLQFWLFCLQNPPLPLPFLPLSNITNIPHTFSLWCFKDLQSIYWQIDPKKIDVFRIALYWLYLLKRQNFSTKIRFCFECKYYILLFLALLPTFQDFESQGKYQTP